MSSPSHAVCRNADDIHKTFSSRPAHTALEKLKLFVRKRFGDVGRKFLLARKQVLWGQKCQCIYTLR